MDLIYPGYTRDYGHGHVLPYDLQHLGDRAGWVLEHAAFQDFGFGDPAWLPPAHDLAGFAARRVKARAAVAAWWATVGADWSCYDALATVLRSKRPARAYRWLIDRDAVPCDGFTADRYARAGRLLRSTVASAS